LWLICCIRSMDDRNCPRTGHTWLGIISSGKGPAMVTKAYPGGYTYAVDCVTRPQGTGQRGIRPC